MLFFFRSVKVALLGPQALTGFAVTITLVTVFTLGLSQRTPYNALFSRGLTPITSATMDGFAPSAETCAECHQEAYQEWATSRHAASFSNPNFQHSVIESPFKDWCLNCHQPLRTLVDEQNTASSDGVSCAVCHIREDTLLVSRPLSKQGSAQHPNARIVPELQSSTFCAGCHQFSGPTSTMPVAYKGDPVQNTYKEWAAHPGAQGECQTCHMPQGKHTFLGAHNTEWVNKSLSVTQQQDTLVIATTAAVGHAVPTGDPFRRMELRFCSKSCDTVVQRHVFGIVHQYIDGVMRIVQDTRLQAPGMPGDSVRIALPDIATHWELTYFFADPRLHDALPKDEVSVLLQSGSIARPESAAIP